MQDHRKSISNKRLIKKTYIIMPGKMNTIVKNKIIIINLSKRKTKKNTIKDNEQ